MSDLPHDSHPWMVDGLEDTPHGQVARVELPDGTAQDIPVVYLPPTIRATIREGDQLAITAHAGGLEVQLLPQATQHAHAEAQAKLEALNSTDLGQEITL